MINPAAPPRMTPPPVPEGVRVVPNLVFAMERGYRPLELDLYLPPTGGPSPAIVFVHGGGWMAGHRRFCAALPLVLDGYAVASISYRLSAEAQYPVQLHDVKAAIRWLRAHASEYSVDVDRVAIWGASAGAHLAALAGVTNGRSDLEGAVGGNMDQSSGVRAVVTWYCPTDFTQMDAHLPEHARVHVRAGSPESMLMGFDISQNPEGVQAANPLTYITKDAPPFLLMHGDADEVVPHHQSELLLNALRRAGVTASLITLPGARHGDPRFNQPGNLDKVREFLSDHVG